MSADDEKNILDNPKDLYEEKNIIGSKNTDSTIGIDISENTRGVGVSGINNPATDSVAADNADRSKADDNAAGDMPEIHILYHELLDFIAETLYDSNKKYTDGANHINKLIITECGREIMSKHMEISKHTTISMRRFIHGLLDILIDYRKKTSMYLPKKLNRCYIIHINSSEIKTMKQESNKDKMIELVYLEELIDKLIDAY